MIWQQNYEPDDWSTPGIVHKVKIVRVLGWTLERLKLKHKFHLRDTLRFVEVQRDSVVMKELLDE